VLVQGGEGREEMAGLVGRLGWQAGLAGWAGRLGWQAGGQAGRQAGRKHMHRVTIRQRLKIGQELYADWVMS